MANAFETVSFNAETYTNRLRLAGNAWRNAEGKGDDFARDGIAALVTDSLSPMALALSIYDEMEPKDAKGRKAEPKESEKAACGVSVSNLRNAKGGEAARSTLEAVFYIVENRDMDAPAVAAFVRGDKAAFRLYPLKAHLAKAKLEAAKEAAETALAGGEGEGVPAKEGQEGAPVPAIVTEIAAFTAKIATLGGEDLTASAEALGKLLEECRKAADRLAAAETITRTGTEG